MPASTALKKSVRDYYCAKSPVYWAKIRRTLHGKPYKFWGDHPVEQRMFLEAPLNDTSQRVCGKKARQLGWSENSVTFALWFADTHPHTGVIYTLPTNDFVSDFSNTRVQPAIDSSPYLRRVVGDVYGSGGKRRLENVKLKKINYSYLFLRSMGSERAGMGFPIDLAVWDEVDASNEYNKEVFRAMLDASKFKWERELSTPTIPGRGISRTYELSDKKKWEVKCTKCGRWQFMEFPHCIGDYQGKYHFLCEHCHGLDTLDRAHGRWVVTAKEADYSGYHVSQLEAPWFTAEDIMFKKRTSRHPQLFYNLVLGLDYVGDNVLLTEEDIEFCVAPEVTREVAMDMKRRGKVLHGIDWGDTTWGLTGVPVRWEGREKLLITDIHRWDDPDINMHTRYIGMMIRTNESLMTILDAGYGKAQNLTLMKEFRGNKVYACQYVQTQRGATARVVPVWTEKQSRVTVQRDAQIKYYFQHFKDKMFVIPGYLKDDPNWKNFVSHSTALVISREDDKGTGDIVEKIENIRDDHLAHAGVYLMTAFEKISRSSVAMGFI